MQKTTQKATQKAICLSLFGVFKHPTLSFISFDLKVTCTPHLIWGRVRDQLQEQLFDSNLHHCVAYPYHPISYHLYLKSIRVSWIFEKINRMCRACVTRELCVRETWSHTYVHERIYIALYIGTRLLCFPEDGGLWYFCATRIFTHRRQS